jgi:hypothetical protein
MKIIEWFKGVFQKHQSSKPLIIVDLEVEPNTISVQQPSPPIIKVEEPMVVEDKNIRKFYHTQHRILERYGYYLSRETYDNWNKLIANGSSKVKFVESRNVGKLYMVELCMKNVFVVYHEGAIVTALASRPDWVRKARANYRPKGKASKQVGRGNLGK